MSSGYPVLDNRPIDQWKVTELREELRRRRIATKGLKEELVRRLFDAIESEKESAPEEELNNGFDPNSEPGGGGDDEEEPEKVEEGDTGVDDEEKIEKAGKDVPVVDTDDKIPDVNQGVTAEVPDTMCDAGLEGTVKETTVDVVSGSDTTAQFESCSNDLEHDEERGVSKASDEDAKLSPTEPNNQVSEVSTDLGFQVKCDSISTDSVSVFEKNKLEGNLNADNLRLELDVVKPEVVQPSSGDVHTVGDSRPPDEDKGPVKDLASLEVIDAKYATSGELSKKDDSPDGGSPEKLNLDRSSGDESMEEDVLESKDVESKNKYDELGERTEVGKLNDGEARAPVDAMAGGLSPDKKVAVADEIMKPASSVEKRKLGDHEVVATNETSKRQRRWSSDTLKVPERQPSSISSSTPKDTFQPTPKPIFARSDSTVSGGSPKERVVPPSQAPATNSLRIDRFLRPFTLKAVQELLAKTGTVCNFWMDQIKTHCYVTYSSAEEALETRNAVYNLQWPPNGGRLLVAEFVDPQEVKIRVEAPPQTPAPISPSPTASAAPLKQPQAPQPIRQHSFRQQLPPPPPLPLPPPPPLSDPPVVRERLPPPPPPLKKSEPPVVTLDDLFRKTRATPRIYYLPLSEEQVAAKLAAQGKSIRD